jgi:putative transposase
VYRVSRLCRILNVSPSGFYAWSKRPPSAHRQSNIALGDHIEAIYRRSRSTYGRPRIHDDLKDEGIYVSGKRVARLMRERDIKDVSRRKGITTTIRNRDARPAPDLVDRKFQADGADQLWVADITYVPTWAGFLYLAVALSVGRWPTICARNS